MDEVATAWRKDRDYTGRTMAVTYVHGYHERESAAAGPGGSAGRPAPLATPPIPPARACSKRAAASARRRSRWPATARTRGSLDRPLAAASLARGERRACDAGLTNVQFLQADIFALPFAPQSFDHVFVCFVLEHLRARSRRCERSKRCSSRAARSP